MVTLKSIKTLVSDIEAVLSSGVQKVPEDLLNRFSKSVAEDISKSLTDREREPTLRMSSIGKPCERQLWYDINRPELAEKLRPENFMKFMYGHLVENLVLFLAELAGHEVSGRQDTQKIAGIEGHRDAVIDGTLVDVKSASSYSFVKFKNNELTEENDSFGYIPQLQAYLEAGQDDPLIENKDKAYFVVVDKGLGHLTTTPINKADHSIIEQFEQKKALVALPEPPPIPFEPVPHQKSGNMKLATACSYCPFKKECFPELRTFLYSTGPTYLTKVVKVPDVPELT